MHMYIHVVCECGQAWDSIYPWSPDKHAVVVVRKCVGILGNVNSGCMLLLYAPTWTKLYISIDGIYVSWGRERTCKNQVILRIILKCPRDYIHRDLS